MNGFEFEESDNGIRWGYFPCLSQLGLKHGFSTRNGGFSQGDWFSLNLGVKTGDSLENVRRNCASFCHAMDIGQERVVMAGQVHGTSVELVDSSVAGSRVENTDALITNTKGLGLMLFFADCVPLLFYDPVQQAFGISHAGWRGTLAAIGMKTLKAMKCAFSTDPANCIVGIGPSIGPSHYEIDLPVWREIEQRWSGADAFCLPGRPDHWMLDLWAWNRIQLLAAGVLAHNILLSGISTAGRPDLFFSHRASQGRAGRFGALAYL